MLSDYRKKIADKYKIKVGDVKKSTPNLGNKIITNSKNLQLYLFLGMKLTKIHRVLKFKQSAGWKNIWILTMKKEQMLLIVLEKIFLNWWLIVSMSG